MGSIISVIVPVYNKIEYINKCLDSVLSQTYSDLELLLVDDGSTDGSGQVCDEYARKDSRVRVIHKPNGGASEARNLGITEAKGDFIGFIDADDYIDKDFYKSLYEGLMAYPQCNISQVIFFSENTSGDIVTLPLKDSGSTLYLKQADYFKELLLHVGDSSFCTKLFRASWMKKYSFTIGKLNEDFELLLRMLPDIDGIVTIEKPMYHIVESSESNTRGAYKQRLYEDMLSNVERARALVNSSFPEFSIEMDKFELTQCLDFLLHIPVAEMTKDNTLFINASGVVKASKDKIRTNPYFDERQRKNLTILSRYPIKLIRTLHGFIMKLRGVK